MQQHRSESALVKVLPAARVTVRQSSGMASLCPSPPVLVLEPVHPSPVCTSGGAGSVPAHISACGGCGSCRVGQGMPGWGYAVASLQLKDARGAQLRSRCSGCPWWAQSRALCRKMGTQCWALSPLLLLICFVCWGKFLVSVLCSALCRACRVAVRGLQL